MYFRGVETVESAENGGFDRLVFEVDKIGYCGSFSPTISTFQRPTAPLGYLPLAMLSRFYPLVAYRVVISDCTSANAVAHYSRISLLR